VDDNRNSRKTIPPKKIVLVVKDPCYCDCSLEVPICLPSCCKGEPCVTSRCGVLCRGVVTYKWCCGFRVKVIFRNCGDVLVVSYGS